jgi:hypothetical protein
LAAPEPLNEHWILWQNGWTSCIARTDGQAQLFKKHLQFACAGLLTHKQISFLVHVTGWDEHLKKL